MYKHVLLEGNIGKLRLRNRFVMPPMDTSMTDEIDGMVDEKLAAYYAARAKGGFGLIITEFTCVDYPDGLAKRGQLSIYDDRFVPGMKRLADAVHAEGSHIFVQLQHPGRETTQEITGRQTVAPSAVPSMLKGKGLPRALEVDEIHRLTEKFAEGARRAKSAGIDGVEVQCGHGYLVAQFLSGLSNKRMDEYGGSLRNRVRFAAEIVRAIKRRCGSDFPVSCRISGEEHIAGGLTQEDAVIIAKELERAGADAIHVSSGTVASVEWLIAPAAVSNGYNLKAAKAVKEAVTIPVIGIGRVTEPLMAEYVIRDGIADFVSLGRASLADPEFPNKVRDGREEEISPCVGCLSRCFYTEGAIPGERMVSCMLNPFTGHENEMQIKPAGKPCKVVVAGAGPGGLEAAWIAAARGHKVTLLEKSDHVGGQLLPASIPPGKQEMIKGIQFLLKMNQKYGVDIRLETEATRQLIEEMKPDYVIAATGAKPINCPVPCEGIPVIQALDLLQGKANFGTSHAVIGGGLVGLETAAYIASQGYKAVVIEMKEEVGKDLNKAAARFLLQELDELGVKILTSAKLCSISKEGVVCDTPEGQIIIKEPDTVVVAIGSRAYNPLVKELEGLPCEVNVIGDAVRARKAYAAIEEGARAALTI